MIFVGATGRQCHQQHRDDIVHCIECGFYRSANHRECARSHRYHDFDAKHQYVKNENEPKRSLHRGSTGALRVGRGTFDWAWSVHCRRMPDAIGQSQPQESDMPELPEVEAAVVRLRSIILGRIVLTLAAHHASQRRQLPAAAVRRASGKSVVRVERRGKHQMIHLSDGSQLHIHFRMNGDWEFTHVSEPLPRFARVTFDLDNGARVSLTDSRALCTLRYHAPGRPPVLALGPEADNPALTGDVVRRSLATKRGPIKAALLDQRVIAGIGNIYACEALWRGRISPSATAGALSLARVKRLLTGLRAALADGVRNAGHYRTGGRVTPFKVYDREGEPCDRCATKIRRIVQAGRSTYYCANCQR